MMAETDKTLLNDLLQDGDTTSGQSLEELLGMSETDKERDKRLLLQAAERGDQSAIYVVAESFLYGKNGFPEEVLEGMFWISKSTSDETPLLFSDYLKSEKKNLDLAEQGLEILFEADTDGRREPLLCNFAMGLGTEFGRKANVSKCLKWLKRAEEHVDAELMGKLFEWIYKNVLKNKDAFSEYCKEAVAFLEKRLETKEDKEILDLLTKYHPVKEKWLGVEEARVLLSEAQQAGSTVLRIPSGYTDIKQGAFYYITTPYIQKITEIILPETIKSIQSSAFTGCRNLRRINLPKRLQHLGEWALRGSMRKGFLITRTAKSNNEIEELVIPANTCLEDYSLGDISRIGCLQFKEGREKLEWSVFRSLYQKTRIREMILPNSIKTITNLDTYTHGLLIEKLIVPEHLKETITQLQSSGSGTTIQKVCINGLSE